MKYKRKTLNESAIRKYVYETNLKWNLKTFNKSIREDSWELTNKMSLDTTSTPCADTEFKWVVLRNGKYFDSITDVFAQELIRLLQ